MYKQRSTAHIDNNYTHHEYKSYRYYTVITCPLSTWICPCDWRNFGLIKFKSRLYLFTDWTPVDVVFSIVNGDNVENIVDDWQYCWQFSLFSLISHTRISQCR